MSVVAYWKIRQELLRVDGVANVAIWGEHLKQEHVEVDPALLAENGVSLQQVMDQTADSLDAGLLRYSEGHVIGTGGYVEQGGQRLDVQNVLPILGPEDLAKVSLEGTDGKNLRLEDVANVKWDSQPLIGDAVVNNGPGLLLVVQKFPNANTLDVTRGVEEAIDDMRPGLPGMQIDTTIFRPATFIELALDHLTKALLLGVLLVVLILAAFLFEWRTAFISLIAIPLSLLAAVLVLVSRSATINVMMLAGLIVAIGVVVDDAIIDVENIVRRLRQNRSEGTGKSTFAIVLEASVEVRTAITYATLINVVAIVPAFFLPGLSGAFFKPLVLSYGLAVLASMVVALTVTPALCLILLSRGHQAPGIPPAAGAKAGLRGWSCAHHPHPASGDGHRRRVPCGRRRGDTNARGGPVSDLQGEGLPDALVDEAGQLGKGRDAYRGSGLQGYAGDPWRSQLRIAHRAGFPGGGDIRCELRRELDQRQSRGGL